MIFTEKEKFEIVQAHEQGDRCLYRSNSSAETREKLKNIGISLWMAYDLITKFDNNYNTCKTCGKQIKRPDRRYCSGTCANRNDEIKNKKIETSLSHYGVAHPMMCTEVKDVLKKAFIDKYGVDNPQKDPSIKKKTEETCLVKYGFSSAVKNSDVKAKIQATLVARYGENPFKNEEIVAKREATCVERYGYKSNLSSEENKAKQRATNVERYGDAFPQRTEEIKSKIKATNIARYGGTSPAASKEVIEKAKKRQREKHFDLLPTQLKYTNYELLSSREDFIDQAYYSFKCNKHNVIFETTTASIQKIRCPECDKDYLYYKSKGETEVLNFIKSIYKGNIIENDRTLIAPKEVDIHLPDLSLAIEFNGSLYHSTYKIDNKNYHKEKTLCCREQGVRLIHIFEYEWFSQKKKICAFLESAINHNNKKIYARKCKLKEVNREDTKVFLEENHLQGFVNSSWSYGLYFDNTLVEIATFGKSRFKSGETELLRHCTLLGHTVVGGFSKIITFFQKETSLDLVSYVDLSKFTGISYKDWDLSGETSPNYKYIRGTVAYSRQAFQKHKLKDLLAIYEDDLTEEQNMALNNYFRLYDSGNLKYIKKYERVT